MFEIGLVFVLGLLLLLLLLFVGVDPSSLEQACIMQLMHVRVRPPVIWLINVLRFIALKQTTQICVQFVLIFSVYYFNELNRNH